MYIVDCVSSINVNGSERPQHKNHLPLVIHKKHNAWGKTEGNYSWNDIFLFYSSSIHTNSVADDKTFFFIQRVLRSEYQIKYW